MKRILTKSDYSEQLHLQIKDVNRNRQLVPVLITVLFFILSTNNAYSSKQWHLPDGASARLGKGRSKIVGRKKPLTEFEIRSLEEFTSYVPMLPPNEQFWFHFERGDKNESKLLTIPKD